MADTSVASQAGSNQAGSNQANQQNGGGQNGQAAVGGSPSPAKLGGPALWTAVGALVIWVAFSIVLLFNISKNETEWTRIAWVFGSIQSVAFAAAGALFGTAVQQQNVSTAQQQAATAKQDADQQRDAATKGRALAAVMQPGWRSPRSRAEIAPVRCANQRPARPEASRESSSCVAAAQ